MAAEEAPSWYKEPCMLGIDEAGRGPVLGPMVYAVAFAPINRSKDLKGMGFADSKTLTEEKRDRLFGVIQQEPILGHEADVLSAALISGKMLSRDKVSLNQLAFDSTCKLIDAVLSRGVNLAEAFIDALGDTTRHKERLSERFPGVQFVVEAKADATYPIVSAASIVAKVTRDRCVHDFVLEELAAAAPANGNGDGDGSTDAAAADGVGSGSTSSAAAIAATAALQQQQEQNFGSGYPGDPETKRWLEAAIDPVFGFPSLVRFSWSTCTPLLEQHAAAVKFECDADDVPGQQVLSFSAKVPACTTAASSGTGRHSYFRARKLQRVQLGF